MGADEVSEQCKYILRQLKKTQPSIITVRDIMRLCQRFKTAEAIAAPLARLCEYDYMRELLVEQISGRGRPSAKQYEINPATYSMNI